MDIPQTPEKKLYNGKPAPLICWDIYSDFLSKQRSKTEDINFLKTFLKDKKSISGGNWIERLTDVDAVVVTSLNKTIEWVSSGFVSMTGYTKSEAIDRKPSFLQGEKTETKIVREIGGKLALSNNVKADLINYRKNGEAYICHIEIEPIFDKDDKLVRFMAFEKEI